MAVDGTRKGLCRPQQLVRDRDGCLHLGPVPTQLAANDAGELIEHLYPDHAPIRQQPLCACTAVIAGSKGVDEDIGVEERSAAIGLIPIEPETLGQRFFQGTQSRQSLLPGAITSDFKSPRSREGLSRLDAIS